MNVWITLSSTWFGQGRRLSKMKPAARHHLQRLHHFLSVCFVCNKTSLWFLTSPHLHSQGDRNPGVLGEASIWSLCLYDLPTSIVVTLVVIQFHSFPPTPWLFLFLFRPLVFSCCSSSYSLIVKAPRLGPPTYSVPSFPVPCQVVITNVVAGSPSTLWWLQVHISSLSLISLLYSRMIFPNVYSKQRQ